MDTSKKILVASGNAHKLQEMSAYFLGQSILVQPASNLSGIDENAPTFIGNAEIKARHIVEEATLKGVRFTLGDDSGFVVDALAGKDGLDAFPGVHSNRWLTQERRAELLGIDDASPITHPQRCDALYRLLEGVELDQRHGYFACAIVLYDIKKDDAHRIEGRCPVQVRDDGKLVGSNGFGYDPMVHPLNDDGNPLPYTMAELSMSEKNIISHRGQALNKLSLLLATL